ncbi:MAG TPA: TA system VapC family ribonuclease toxin [Rhodanobacter sp.]|nr:TA system VapC family ribonuclease toxin [Rhodanobacter sp.]
MSPSKARRAAGIRDKSGHWQSDAPVFLLDVNVLIALLDPMHTQHMRAHAWFADAVTAWASCALTQNGFLRIVSHPRYANPLASPGEAMPVLAEFCARPDHRFWSDDISLLDAAIVDAGHLLSSGQITDSYLLALAVKHGARLATFDKRLVTSAVHGGEAARYVID